MHDKFIDTERIISEKNPKLLKILPRFLLNYLKKTLHEDDLNELFDDQKGVPSYEFCAHVMERWNIDLHMHGLDNIPDEGGTYFASNHPLGGIDAIALIHCLQFRRRDIRFIVNDVLLKLPNLKELFVGVNKIGTTPKEALKQINELFDSDHATCIFPAGLVSRRIRGEIRDPQWKKTFITKARQLKKPVVPVHIDGHLSSFFYNLSNLRRKLGIKTNVEMLYLADELYQHYGRTVNVRFGKPIPPETFDRSKSDQEWASWVKERVYELADQN